VASKLARVYLLDPVYRDDVVAVECSGRQLHFPARGREHCGVQIRLALNCYRPPLGAGPGRVASHQVADARMSPPLRTVAMALTSPGPSLPRRTPVPACAHRRD